MRGCLFKAGIFWNWESSAPWINYGEQQLQSHMSTGQKMLTCWKGEKSWGKNISLTDNQTSDWPWVSILPLAPSPRMLRFWHAALAHKQPSEKQQRDRSTIPQQCNRTHSPPKSAAACRVVLRTVWGQAGLGPAELRGSQSGTLLWKMSVSTVHSDRKRWLMSLKPFPALKKLECWSDLYDPSCSWRAAVEAAGWVVFF